MYKTVHIYQQFSARFILEEIFKETDVHKH